MPHAVLAGGGQVDAEPCGRPPAKKRVRHLQEDAGAVAGVLLAAAGAAVLEVQQDLDRLLDDLVRLAALEVDDEADAAGVVLVARIVEALFPRRPERHGRVLDHLGVRTLVRGRLLLSAHAGPCLDTVGVVRRRQSRVPGREPGRRAPDRATTVDTMLI